MKYALWMAMLLACGGSDAPVNDAHTQPTATASAATNPCTSASTPVASVPTNPFGANVTIFDPSMSVASINAALNATPPAGGGRREFFFLPGTYGDPSVTPATATTSNVVQAEVAPRHGCRGSWQEPM